MLAAARSAPATLAGAGRHGSREAMQLAARHRSADLERQRRSDIRALVLATVSRSQLVSSGSGRAARGPASGGAAVHEPAACLVDRCHVCCYLARLQQAQAPAASSGP